MQSSPPSPSAQAILDAIGDGIVTTDAAGTVTYLNAAAESMTAWSRAEAVGHPITTVLRLVAPGSHLELPSPLLLAMSGDHEVALPPHCLLIGRDGGETPVEDAATPIHDAAGRVIGAVIVFRHVGSALAQALAMTHAALHDVLTGLPNRLLLTDRLSSALASARRRHGMVAVAFIDIDHFKKINDRAGHPTGDLVLRAVAAGLQGAVRQSDTVGRYGGDEFVVVLTEIAGRGGLPALAATLLAAGGGARGGLDIEVSVSLGLAASQPGDSDAQALIARADRAMYGAKAQGPGRFALAADAFEAGSTPRIGATAHEVVRKRTDAGRLAR